MLRVVVVVVFFGASVPMIKVVLTISVALVLFVVLKKLVFKLMFCVTLVGAVDVVTGAPGVLGAGAGDGGGGGGGGGGGEGDGVGDGEGGGGEGFATVVVLSVVVVAVALEVVVVVVALATAVPISWTSVLLFVQFEVSPLTTVALSTA